MKFPFFIVTLSKITRIVIFLNLLGFFLLPVDNALHVWLPVPPQHHHLLHHAHHLLHLEPLHPPTCLPLHVPNHTTCSQWIHLVNCGRYCWKVFFSRHSRTVGKVTLCYWPQPPAPALQKAYNDKETTGSWTTRFKMDVQTNAWMRTDIRWTQFLDKVSKGMLQQVFCLYSWYFYCSWNRARPEATARN